MDWAALESIKSIAVDSHQGQLKGLYLFLGHNAFMKLLHFCTVHFKRAAKEALDADKIDGRLREEAQRRMAVILADADLGLATKLTVDDSLTWFKTLGKNCKGTFDFYARKQNRMCIFPAYSEIDTLTRLSMPRTTQAKESTHRAVCRLGKNLDICTSQRVAKGKDILMFTSLEQSKSDGVPLRQKDMGLVAVSRRREAQSKNALNVKLLFDATL